MVRNEIQRRADVGSVVAEQKPADAGQHGQVPVKVRRDTRIQLLEHITPRRPRGPRLRHHRTDPSPFRLGHLIQANWGAPLPTCPGGKPARQRAAYSNQPHEQAGRQAPPGPPGGRRSGPRHPARGQRGPNHWRAT
jgi:hypothetical protein